MNAVASPTPVHDSPPSGGSRLRILHLVEPAWRDWSGRAGGSDGAVLLCAEAIRSTPQFDHTPLLIGGADAEAAAASMGLATTDRIHPVRNSAAIMVRSLQRFVEDRGPFDLFHVWDPLHPGRAAAVAQDAPAFETRNNTLCWSNPDAAVTNFFGETTGFVPAGLAPVQRWSRRQLRESLSFEHDDVLIAVLSDRPGESVAQRLLWTMAMLRLIGVPASAVVPSTVRKAEHLRVLNSQMGSPGGLAIVREPVTSLLSACDVAVLLEGGTFAGGLALVRAALSLGVPVAAPRPCLDGLPAELVSSLVLEGRTARHMHEALLRALAARPLPAIPPSPTPLSVACRQSWLQEAPR